MAGYQYGDNYWRAAQRFGALPPTAPAAAPVTPPAATYSFLEGTAPGGPPPGGAAPAPAAAPAAGAKGFGYKAGKLIGKTAGRFLAPLGLGAMGMGMADQAAAIQADPQSKPLLERTLQVLSGADVFGVGKGVANYFGLGSPATAPAPVAAPVMTPDQTADGTLFGGYGAVQRAAPEPVVAPAPVAAPAPRTPFTDVQGTSVPQPGMGAIRNSRTGVVTSIDTGVPAAPGFGARPALSPAASFFNAGAQLKVKANDQAAGMAKSKLLLDLLTKQPGMAKDAAETESLAERMRLAKLEPDPAKAALILTGRAQPAASQPLRMYPTMDANKVDVFNQGTGAVVRKTPTLETRAGVARGTDGKFYVLGPDGAAMREATKTEQERYSAGK